MLARDIGCPGTRSLKLIICTAMGTGRPSLGAHFVSVSSQNPPRAGGHRKGHWAWSSQGRATPPPAPALQGKALASPMLCFTQTQA